MRVDSPAWSGKVSQTSCRTSGGAWPHTETREQASCVIPHSERHQFPHPLKIRTRCPGTSSNVTLRVKSLHEGALTPQFHHPEKPQVPNATRQVACHPVNNGRGKWTSIPENKTRLDTPVPTLQRPCDWSQKWRGTLRFTPQLEMRPYSPLQQCIRNSVVPLATPK